MKKIFIFLILLTNTFYFSQKTSYEILAGVTFPQITGGQNDISDSGFDFKTGFNLGIICGYPINLKSELQLGFFYQTNKLKGRSFSNINNPINFETQKNFIWIPLYYRYTFGKGFFFKTGILSLLDLDSKNVNFKDYSGLGLGLVLGKDFRVSNNLEIQLNPYINFNSLVKFSSSNPYRMLDFGIQMGIKL